MHIPRLVPVGLGLAVLAAICFSVINWPPRWGSDLAGGIQLIYPLAASGSQESEASNDGPIDWPKLIQSVQRRASFAGTQDVIVRQNGDREVEIISPACDEVDRQRIEYIKQMVSVAGHLEFRIIANHRDHADVIAAAESLAQTGDPAARRQRSVRSDKNATITEKRQQVGYWAQVGKSTIRAAELQDFVLRDPSTGELIDLEKLTPIRDDNQTVGEYLSENQLSDIEILVATNDGCDVTNDDFSRVLSQLDEHLQPCVDFRMNRSGAERLAALTGSNMPELDESPPFYRHLGIILDGQLLTFPRLRSRIFDTGRIAGNFSPEELHFLVALLRTKPLPVRLSKLPTAEKPIGPDTMALRGAIVFAAAALLVHVLLGAVMLARYGQIGLCGCLASVLQVCLMIAGICTVRSPVTLMGVAQERPSRY